MALICHCRAVRDCSIKMAVRAGARSVDDVMAMCGAGTDCGGCHIVIQDLIALDANEHVNPNMKMLFTATTQEMSR